MIDAKTLGKNMNTLTMIAFIGIIIKLFIGQGPTADGSGGPASSAIWGYGTIVVAVLGIIFVTFGMATQMAESPMSELNENSISFIKSLFMHSLPPVLMLIILVWLISINVTYFKQINEGRVASEYNSYNNLSTIMVMIQLIALYKYMTDELHAGEGGTTSVKALRESFGSKLASLTYLLSLGNVMVAGIMTIILKYFTTDG